MKCALALPVISGAVPASFTLGNEQSSGIVRSIAAELCKLGHLRDVHWDGSLNASINNALEELITEDWSIGDLGHLPFNLYWIDDLQQSGRESFQSDIPTSAFVLVLSQQTGLVTVGHWITQFERMSPGLGFDIYQVLNWAVDLFLGMTPNTMYQIVGEWYDDDPGQFDGEDETLPMAFERQLPHEVINYREPNIERMLEACDRWDFEADGDEGVLREALEHAIELHKLHARSVGLNQIGFYCSHRPEPGIAIRWQTDHNLDPTGRIMDDEMQAVMEGESTEATVVVAFETPEQIGNALQRLQLILETAKCLDALAEVLDDERPIAQVEIQTQVRLRI